MWVLLRLYISLRLVVQSAKLDYCHLTMAVTYVRVWRRWKAVAVKCNFLRKVFVVSSTDKVTYRANNTSKLFTTSTLVFASLFFSGKNPTFCLERKSEKVINGKIWTKRGWRREKRNQDHVRKWQLKQDANLTISFYRKKKIFSHIFNQFLYFRNDCPFIEITQKMLFVCLSVFVHTCPCWSILDKRVIRKCIFVCFL